MRVVAAISFAAIASAVPLLAAEGDGSSTPLAVPPLTAHVNDLTNTLDAQQRQTLESELTALDTAKGAQLGVLIVSTTQPEDIAQYGIRVGDAWKLGRKGTDDGVILIVARNDRKVRIEVGRGLEGAIPDAAAARIIREYITPKFRANDYFGGIHDATGVLTGLINGEPLPPPLTPDHGSPSQGDWFNAVIFAMFAILWSRAMFGRLPGPPRGGLVGIIGGGAAWLLSGGMLPLALGLGAVGLVLGLLGGGGGGFVNRGGWGGFPGGGFGGGSFGGGGGGGGFSGGGGSFGGGGASGGW